MNPLLDEIENLKRQLTKARNDLKAAENRVNDLLAQLGDAGEMLEMRDERILQLEEQIRTNTCLVDSN